MKTLKPGDSLSGFEVTRATQLQTAPAVVYELKHPGSGARIVHYACDDPENLFSISFPTPPSDDTGLPHIMEHSVLSGSRKFPLKDPFFAMAKVSMSTFLNAMTGPDCTYYPVASNVKQDIFNLADVYFDAVFHPLISRDTFDREAYHFAPADPAAPKGDLTVRGVVYNEMQAYAADPGYRFWYRPLVELLEGTIYVYESGGDPKAIPDLTYEQFTAFHKTFYQPANARFLIYGDIPTAEWMAFLAERIDDLEPATLPDAIYEPKRWKSPRTTRDTYPIGDKEPATERTYFGMFWLAGDALDPQERILLKLLSTILIGNDAAPLKKAIVDSKLGAGLASSGEGDIGPQVVFSVGLKGSEPDRGGPFETLVMDTLTKLADNGIDAALVDAAFQQVSYSDLEISSGYPLSRMSRIIKAWSRDRDPVTFLESARHLQDCRELVDKEPGIFSRLIRERLLDNQHRLLHTLTPDREWQKRHQEATRERMAKRRAGLNDEEAAAAAERAAALEELNGAADDPKALATLPRLELSDLPAEPRAIPVTWETPADTLTLGYNDVFANGINYLELDVDLSGLPAHLWQYVPRFCQAFEGMGTKQQDYAEIARRKAAHTGGLHVHHSVTTSIEPGSRVTPRLHLSLKTLDSGIKPGLEIAEELLFGLEPCDMDRLKVLTQQALTDARKRVVQDAMHTAAAHAKRNASAHGYLIHQVEGLHQLRLLESLASDDQLEDLAGRIERIRDFIIANGHLTAGFTGTDKSFAAVRERLVSWAGRRHPVAPAALTWDGPDARREGLAGALDISYCSCPLVTMPFTDPTSPLLELGAHLVSHDYMLQEVRIKGTAYGAGFRYAPHNNDVQIYSYRDPQIARTISVIGEIPEYVKRADWTRQDIEQAAIAVSKSYLTPVRPAAATNETLNHRLIGLTTEIRSERFAKIKAATPGQVKQALLDLLQKSLASAPLCVTSNRAKLEEANKALGDKPLVIEDILG